MLTWRENSHWQNSKKNTTLSLSLNYLHLQTGRIKIRLKPIEEKKHLGMRYEACKLKNALILSNVRLCRTKADISKSVQNGFSSETFVTRSMDWPKHCIVLFRIQRNQANAGTKDHRVQALLSLPPSLSLSLSLSLSSSSSSFTTCVQSLQIIWIQKIVGCFAEPDQGLTVIPRVNLVRACAILRPMRTIRWAS